MKIAVLGGSFNPIHKGHLMLAEGFAEFISADKIMLIPTFLPPHKSAEGIVSPHHRINMCRLSLPDERFSVNDIEIKRGKISYTVDTVKEILVWYPNADIYFLCGSDMFLTLDSWYHWAELKQLATFCTTVRGDEEDKVMKKKENLMKNGAKVVLHDFKIPLFSSTKIRDKIKNGESVDTMLPPKVMQYIKQNGLYGAE